MRRGTPVPSPPRAASAERGVNAPERTEKLPAFTGKRGLLWEKQRVWLFFAQHVVIFCPQVPVDFLPSPANIAP